MWNLIPLDKCSWIGGSCYFICMRFLDSRVSQAFGDSCGLARMTPGGPAGPGLLLRGFGRYGFASLLLCLILLGSMSLHAQNASDVAQSRLSCAQGLAQQGVSRVQAMGVRMGAVEMCVRALSWTASNADLLDIYVRGTGRGGARLLVNRLTENARVSTNPFRASGAPLEMWQKGELTPSLAFDAGFVRSYMEKTGAPTGTMNAAELQKRTEGCLNEAQSLAVCADAGRIQGSLAYQMNHVFTDKSASPSLQSASQGPDRAAAAAAIDRKFQEWARRWSWDRYHPGSVQVTGVDCSAQCTVSGRFTFDRLGALHTIPFAAFMSSEGNGKYSVARLCYNDDTKNIQDCAN
jgi:hypothetical protein